MLTGIPGGLGTAAFNGAGGADPIALAALGINLQQTGDPDLLKGLRKSLPAAYPTPNAQSLQANSSAALQQESVDPFLINASYANEHFVLLRLMMQHGMFAPAKALVHQFTRQERTYNPYVPGAVGLTAVGPQIENMIKRLFVEMKGINARGDYPFVLDALGANIIQPTDGSGHMTMKDMEYQRVAMQLAGSLTDLMYYGNEDVSDHEFTGIIPQVEADGVIGENIIDMRGRPLTADIVKRISTERSEDIFSAHNALLSAPTTAQDIERQAQVQGRVQVGTGTSLMLGNTVKGIKLNSGAEIVPHGDVFLSRARMKLPTEASSADAPSAPTVSGGGGAAPAGRAPAGAEVSQFGASDAGEYLYGLLASGAKGHSAGVTLAPVAIGEGEVGAFTLNDSGVTGVFYYHLWRTDPDGTKLKYLGRVTKAAAGNTTFVDDNSKIAGTNYAVLTRLDPSYFCFAQIGNLLAMPEGSPMRSQPNFQMVNLGLTELVQPFVMFMFGTLYMNLIKRTVLFKNVGVLESDALLAA